MKPWDIKITSTIESVTEKDRAGYTYYDRLEFLSRNSDIIEIHDAIRLCCDLRWCVAEIRRLRGEDPTQDSRKYDSGQREREDV